MRSKKGPNDAKATPAKAKRNSMKGSTSDIDKDALKIFSDVPKMGVTVVSFVTSAGAIMFRLGQSSRSASSNETVDLTFFQELFSWNGLLSVFFVAGLAASFWSILLSYSLISSITACFLDITDKTVEKEIQEQSWASIRDDQYPVTETAMMLSVAIWLFVILCSAFSL